MPSSETRYWILLATLVAVLTVGQPIAAAGYGLLGLTLVFSAVLVAGAFAVGEGRPVRWVSLVVVGVALGAEFIVFTTESRVALLIARLLALGYLVFATVLILARILREDRVTGDTILGGCSVYLLIGVAFTSAHSLIELLAPGAYLAGGEHLQDVGEGVARYPELIYFSFVTLTTLGYGDITPEHPVAQVVSNLEAVIGQLFLAILIARLVGQHLSHRREESKR